jgi:hypothetical protein
MTMNAPPLDPDQDRDSPPLTSCEALRLTNPERVSRLSPPTRLGVYAVSEVLFMGSPSQALCPVNAGDSEPCLLEESWPYGLDSFLPPTRRALARTPAGGCRVLEEAAPLCFVWGDNFWHWIFEGLARIAVLESLGYRGPYIIPPYAHALETAVMLRIPRQRLLMGQQPYFVKRMVVTGHMAPDKFSPCTLQAFHALKTRLNGVLPGFPGVGARRCYIRRIGKRKIRNEQEVIAMLEPMGFETMTPEEHSAMDQLIYMSDAGCSVMAHGANAALAFVQPRDAHFFELFGMGYVNNCNGPMATIAGLHHHQMTEKTEDAVAFAPDRDFEVDVDFLRHRLRKILRMESSRDTPAE